MTFFFSILNIPGRPPVGRGVFFFSCCPSVSHSPVILFSLFSKEKKVKISSHCLLFFFPEFPPPLSCCCPGCTPWAPGNVPHNEVKATTAGGPYMDRRCHGNTDKSFDIIHELFFFFPTRESTTQERGDEASASERFPKLICKSDESFTKISNLFFFFLLLFI
jgi:hypothetical protein